MTSTPHCLPGTDRPRPPDAQPDRLTPDEVTFLVTEQYRDLAWDLAIRIRRTNPTAPLADIHAEVVVGFVKAAKHFDPSRGWTFGTYAYQSGLRAGLVYAYRERAGGLKVPAGHPPYTAPAMHAVEEWDRRLEPDAGETGLGQRHRDPAVVAEFWEFATRGMFPADAEVFLRIYRDGESQRDVAESLGLSRRRVGQVLARAMHRLRTNDALRRYADDLIPPRARRKHRRAA